MEIWELNKYKVHQIDKSISKRLSSWVLICPNCQQERQGTYCQAWNIIKEKSSGKCQNCIEKNYSKLPKIPWNKGKKWNKAPSDKQKKSMEYNYLFDGTFVTDEGRQKQRLAKLGKRDKDTNRYIDGRSKINQKLRNSADYKIWRLTVLRRDNFICQICNQKNKKLEVDHIKEFSNYPELRLDLNNGRTLCVECHKKTPSYKKCIKKEVD